MFSHEKQPWNELVESLATHQANPDIICYSNVDFLNRKLNPFQHVLQSILSENPNFVCENREFNIFEVFDSSLKISEITS